MKLLDTWGELCTGIILLVGLIVSLFVPSFVISIAVILICGIMVGRLYHIRKHKLGFPFFLISAGFLIGLIIGSEVTGYNTPLLVLFLFFVGTWLGDLLMHRKFMK